MVASENQNVRRSSRIAQNSQVDYEEVEEKMDVDQRDLQEAMDSFSDFSQQPRDSEASSVQSNVNLQIADEIEEADVSVEIPDPLGSEALTQKFLDFLKWQHLHKTTTKSEVLQTAQKMKFPRFNGNKKDRGNFMGFYEHLRNLCIENFDSDTHLKSLLLQQVSRKVADKIYAHFGSRPHSGSLNEIVEFLRTTYDRGATLASVLYDQSCDFKQRKNESVEDMRTRWEELMKRSRLQGIPMSESRQIAALRGKFYGDLGTLTFRCEITSLSSLWSNARRIYIADEYKDSGSSKKQEVRSGNRSSRRNVPDASAPHSSAKRGRTSDSSSLTSDKDPDSSSTQGKQKRRKLSQADLKKYRREGRCFKCGEVGHLSRNCKKEEENKDSESYSSSTSFPARSQTCLANLETKGRSNLLELDLQINGITARVLCDGGAAINAISQDFVDTHNLRTVNLSEEDVFDIVGAAPGSLLDTCRRKCMNVTVSGPGKLNFTDDHFYVTRLSYDIILGKPWLAKHNPQIDWRNNLITFKFHNGSHVTWKANGSCKKKELNGMCSAKKICSLLRKQRVAERSFMLVIRDAHHDSQSKSQGSDFILEYADVFPTELPKRLPPHRHIEHDIILKEGSSPSFQYPYRMSPTQKAEVEKVVKELLDLGYIRPSMSPWGAPVLFAPKSDGTLRFCIDDELLKRRSTRGEKG